MHTSRLPIGPSLARLPRRRAASHAPRGTLLVVALMIILVLAGIALIGVRNVSMELKTVGNFRAGEQASRVTEGGMLAVIALAVSKGDAFPQFVQAANYTIRMTDVSDAFFDVAAGGSFGYEFTNVGGVDFVTTLSSPIDTNRIPGYPVSDSFVWKKYRMETAGYYGNRTVTSPDDTLRNSLRRVVGFTYVGPYSVGGGGQ